MTDPKIIVAIDTYDLVEANSNLDQLDPNLCMIKVGSVVFNSLGKSFLKSVSNRGFKIFLDLKLYDIPNTIHKTILGFKDCSIEMLTIHLSGGEMMIKEAMHAANIINSKVIGVSILTSLKESDMSELFNSNMEEQIIRLFKIAKKTNIDGIVCSPLELNMANQILGVDVIKITPGIRELEVDDDQERTMNAKEAIQRGASFLVIGRPITQAKNISTTLINFVNSIDE